MRHALVIYAFAVVMSVAGAAHAQSINGGNGSSDQDLLSRANLYPDGLRVVKVNGHNPDIGNATQEDIWAVGGTYPFPTTALPMRVKAGGNAADTAAGAGARTIRIEGLDGNWDAAAESLTLAGASASAATSTSFIRVNLAYVETAGTYTDNNVGDIDIETTGGTLLMRISAGIGKTQIAGYTVPDGYTAFLTNTNIVVSSTNKSATIFLWQRQSADDVSAPLSPKRMLREFNDMTSVVYDSMHTWDEFPARTDIWASAISVSTTSHVDVTFSFVLKETP